MHIDCIVIKSPHLLSSCKENGSKSVPSQIFATGISLVTCYTRSSTKTRPSRMLLSRFPLGRAWKQIQLCNPGIGVVQVYYGLPYLDHNPAKEATGHTEKGPSDHARSLSSSSALLFSSYSCNRYANLTTLLLQSRLDSLGITRLVFMTDL